MSAPVTARELEAARALLIEIGQFYYTGSDGWMDEDDVEKAFAQAIADADAAGYERGRREQREADAIKGDSLATFFETVGEHAAARATTELSAAIRASAGPDGRET